MAQEAGLQAAQDESPTSNSSRTPPSAAAKGQRGSRGYEPTQLLAETEDVRARASGRLLLSLV